MKYCPNCKFKFNDSFDRCVDCGADLISIKFCPTCKREYIDESEICADCGVTLLSKVPSVEETGNDELESEESKFKRNFWSAFAIVLTGTIFCFFILIGNLVGNYYVSPWILSVPFIICLMIWIISCIKKRDGKNGWIAGGLVGLVVFFLIFGGCVSLAGL